MPENIETLILDLLQWIGPKGRNYHETMDAWRTSCPKLPVWEEANLRALLEQVKVDGKSLVRLTPAGVALLNEKRSGISRGDN
jgi:hypothetical protein